MLHGSIFFLLVHSSPLDPVHTTVRTATLCRDGIVWPVSTCHSSSSHWLLVHDRRRPLKKGCFGWQRKSQCQSSAQTLFCSLPCPHIVHACTAYDSTDPGQLSVTKPGYARPSPDQTRPALTLTLTLTSLARQTQDKTPPPAPSSLIHPPPATSTTTVTITSKPHQTSPILPRPPTSTPSPATEGFEQQASTCPHGS